MPINRDGKHWCDPASEEPQGRSQSWTCPDVGAVRRRHQRQLHAALLPTHRRADPGGPLDQPQPHSRHPHVLAGIHRHSGPQLKRHSTCRSIGSLKRQPTELNGLLVQCQYGTL